MLIFENAEQGTCARGGKLIFSFFFVSLQKAVDWRLPWERGEKRQQKIEDFWQTDTHLKHPCASWFAQCSAEVEKKVRAQGIKKIQVALAHTSQCVFFLLPRFLVGTLKWR